MTGRDLLKELEDYAKDFIQTEKFHELENSHGLSFEILADEYQRNKEKIVELKGEVESLQDAKSQLSDEIKPLTVGGRKENLAGFSNMTKAPFVL